MAPAAVSVLPYERIRQFMEFSITQRLVILLYHVILLICTVSLKNSNHIILS